MLANLFNWLDDRTGYRKLRAALLLEHIPGGAKWRYVWGSCLAFVFALQLITGLLLMAAYSPNARDAWSSVYFIQYQMEFGWLIRGLHHFGSQTMVVLLALHMLQVVIAGAHLPPREINWWLGLALMALVLGLSLTGYLLPWDQKGYWATRVATNIAGSLPIIGNDIKVFVVGGDEYGSHTVSRFFALHVGVLPALLVILLGLHIAVFRRHGITTDRDAVGEGMFWPDQAFRDMLACMGVFAIMLGLVVFGGHGNAAPDEGAGQAEKTLWQQVALGGRDGRGANLEAPADPANEYPARPEWYFLFLFQLLKYFEGDYKIIGTVVIPKSVFMLLFLLPLFGIGRMRKFGHAVGVVMVMAILGAAAALTLLALAYDLRDPAARLLLRKLALYGIPAIAAFWLLHLAIIGLLGRGTFRRVVAVAGCLILSALFAGTGFLVYEAMAGLPDATLRAEVEKHLTDPDTEENRELIAKENKRNNDHHNHLQAASVLAKRAIVLADQGIPAEGAVTLLRRDPQTQGKALFKSNCAVCHSYGLDGNKDKLHDDLAKDNVVFRASDLEGYGSKEWIRGLLSNPNDPRYFGRTKLKGMKDWRETVDKRRLTMDKTEKDALDADLDLVAKWLASSPTAPPPAKDAKVPANEDDQAKSFRTGYAAFKKNCAKCHAYGTGDKEAPDLMGYGSADWIRLMVVSPANAARYTKENYMPAFRPTEGDGASLLDLLEPRAPAPVPADMPLSNVDRELIIRWMTGDHRVVFGGGPIGPKKE